MVVARRFLRPPDAPAVDIRCNVGDAMVANLAINVVFFVERHLEDDAWAEAFTHALGSFPLFAGRLGVADGRMRIRCAGQGVPFSTASSAHTLRAAIRSVADDSGRWLIDPVSGLTARWGVGPLCKVRVTHLADGATAIGFSWHHAIGDMATFMLFMNAWTASAAGGPIAAPLLVGDRAAYLDRRLPDGSAVVPGVRFLSLAETVRSAAYLAIRARRQRTVSTYFGDDEIARMRAAYGPRIRLSANDVVCANICAALMTVDAVDHRTLAIAVNVRRRCGLDSHLVGNIITTLQIELRRGDDATSIAERIRRRVDHFTDEPCDIRINQRTLDAAGPVRAARCVSTAFDPAQWNPLVTNLSDFGMYRIRFDGAEPVYCTQVLTLPVPGLGALMAGAGGAGLLFQMSLPPKEFGAMSTTEMQARLHRFRRPDDDIPDLHRGIHDPPPISVVNRRAVPRLFRVVAHAGRDKSPIPRESLRRRRSR